MFSVTHKLKKLGLILIRKNGLNSFLFVDKATNKVQLTWILVPPSQQTWPLNLILTTKTTMVTELSSKNPTPSKSPSLKVV